MSNLPATMSNLKSSIMKAKQRLETSAPGGGDDFLRLTKAQTWEYGADDTEAQEGAKWALNPQSFQMGFIAWGDSSDVLGESMGSIAEDPIIRSELPEVGASWAEQVGVQMRCVTGEDKGQQVLYKTTSKGGRDEFNRILAAVLDRLENNEKNVVPIIKLETSSYKHKKYGKIVTPVLNIVDWKPIEADSVDEDEPAEVEDEPTPAPTKRRRRKVAAA